MTNQVAGIIAMDGYPCQVRKRGLSSQDETTYRIEMIGGARKVSIESSSRGKTIGGSVRLPRP